MPLVAVHKAARNARKLEARGKRPHSPEQRRSWAIAAQTEPAFKTAYTKLLRSLITPEDEKALQDSLQKPGATAESVLLAVPFFNPDDPASRAKWERFAESLDSAYRTALVFSADAELKRQGWKKAVVQKAKQRIPFIPIDKNSLEWMRKRSLGQVVDISASERERLRAILSRAFEAGEHPMATVQAIKDSVGLTANMVERVQRRAEQMFEQGYSDAEIGDEKSRFTDQLRGSRAEAIARTESLEAQTEGLRASWRAAEDQGLMPAGTQKRWIATNDERTSEICLELHDQLVPVNDQFDSSFVGPLDGPPAHPNCRSTMVLEFPQE